MGQKSTAVKALTGGIAHLFKQNKVILATVELHYDRLIYKVIVSKYINSSVYLYV